MTEPNRKIFSFRLDVDDPESVQFRDPFDLHCRWYEAANGDPASFLRATQPPEPIESLQPDGKILKIPSEESNEAYLERLEAYRRLLAVIRQAFELPPFNPKDGSGVIDTEAIRILHEWQDWQEGLKKNTVPAATSAPLSTSIHAARPTTAP